MTEPQPGRASLDLGTPRDIGGLISAGFNLYFREFRTFLAIAAAVVVPVQLIVLGIGLGWFTGDYDASPPAGETLIQLASNFLIVAPLVTAMCIYVLLDVAAGKAPSARSAIQRGLDIFAPLLLVILLYTAAILSGLLLLLVGALWLAIRFGFSIQATVVDGHRGPAALRRSAELVDGTWWRVAGITLAGNLVAGGLSSLIGAPFLAVASATDQAVWQLIGQTLGAVLFAPVAALLTTFLYFDQRVRRGL